MPWRSNLVVILISTGFALLVLELGLRIQSGELFSRESFLRARIDLLRSAYPAEHDTTLGWIPREGHHDCLAIWGTEVTILPHGIRSNGAETVVSTARPILAVGDSFTFGDGVRDHETWPAHLEVLSGRRVVNAGVFGYGLDQAVLRAESLLPEVRPEWVVLSFIHDDVSRAENSMRTGVSKPFFTIENGDLKLQNVPVPAPVGSARNIGPARSALGHSLLVHRLLSGLVPRLWLTGTEDRVRAHENGEQVGCALWSRLEASARGVGAHVLVMGQHLHQASPEQVAVVEALLKCAEEAGLEVLDLGPALREVRVRGIEKYDGLFDGHMTASGNRVVAEELWKVLAPRLSMVGPESGAGT